MDDDKACQDIDAFLKDVEWDRLLNDDLPEPLDEDEPIFKYNEEDE